MRAIAPMLLPLLLLGTAMTASADTPAPSPAPARHCAAAEHRQFDFWIGDWEVYGGPEGNRLLGTNRITRSDTGCWLVEQWQGTSGIGGTSLNAWDAQYRVWRQFWVGGDGVVLRLEGGLRGGTMVMTGELPGAKGGVQLQRIKWTPQADGGLVQQWDTSDDAGATWQVGFRGHYRRRAATAE